MIIVSVLRDALRRLQRSPAHSLAVISTLAIGISVNVTVFGLVSAIMLRPSGVHSPEELISVHMLSPDAASDALGAMSYPVFSALEAEHNLFSGAAAYFEFQEAWADPLGTEIIAGEFISPGYFSTLGVDPILGRVGSATDVNPSEDTVVISERLWRRRFGRHASVIGTTVRINNQPMTIVGVLPDSFRGLQLPTIRPTDAFVDIRNMRRISSSVRDPNILSRFDWLGFRVVARLRAGATLEQAQSRLVGLSAEFAHQSPRLKEQRLVAEPFLRQLIHPGFDPYALPIAGALLGIAAVVLVAVCANVANLLLARTLVQEAEFAVRFALGATRLRLFLLTAADVLLLGMAGGIVGGILARLGWEWSVRSLPAHSLLHTVSVEPSFDPLTLGYTVGISLVGCCALGVIPALRGMRASSARLTGGVFASPGRVSTGMRSALLTVQVCASSFAIVLAAFFLSAGFRLAHRDIGISSQRAVLLGIDLALHPHYSETQGRALARTMLDESMRLPDVIRATLIDWLPLGTGRDPATIRLDGESPSHVDYYRFGDIIRTGPGYFEIVATPILKGRGLRPSDVEGSIPVVVVSQSTANRLWPGEDPIGKRLLIAADAPQVQVIGVAKDTDVRFVGERTAMLFYVPFEQQYSPRIQLLVQSREAPAVALQRVRQVVMARAPDVAIVNAASLDDWISMWTWPYSVSSIILTVFAAIAIVISMMGVYSLLTFAVTHRQRELGIRAACGASNKRLLLTVSTGAILPVTAGTLIGSMAAVLGAEAASRIFLGLLERNMAAAAACAIGIMVFAAFVGYVPARKILRGNPADVLRRL
jgi:putative ABC transport system permease protein